MLATTIARRYADEQLAWLRRLPSERRLNVEGTMLLACHASPGSQTAGFDADLDPSVTLERIMRTEARVICCGHTHLPEVRDFGWKVIVNAGSAGYVFDGDPTASWALVSLEGETVTGEIRRAEFDGRLSDRHRRAGCRRTLQGLSGASFTGLMAGGGFMTRAAHGVARLRRAGRSRKPRPKVRRLTEQDASRRP